MTESKSLLCQLIRSVDSGCDASAAADRLLNVYGSLGTIFEAAPEDIMRLTSLKSTAAHMPGFIAQLARYITQERARQMIRLHTYDRASKYLSGLYVGSNVESFYLLCLDKRGFLLNCTQLNQGTVDESPLYFRDIVETALKYEAHAVVLSHNHPSGTAIFSLCDINCTANVLDVLAPLNIYLVDHILVADGHTFTIRDNPLFISANKRINLSHDSLIDGWIASPENRP